GGDVRGPAEGHHRPRDRAIRPDKRDPAGTGTRSCLTVDERLTTPAAAGRAPGARASAVPSWWLIYSRPRESLCAAALRRHDRTVPAALTYRSLFAIREFRVLFFDRCVVVISVAASGLALATITSQQTRA